MITSNPLRRRAASPAPSAARCRASRCASPRRPACRAGEIGVIEVRGPNVFKGYWRMPREDGRGIHRRRLLHHRRRRPASTPDGYVDIVGRSKDLIITGGYNVYPEEIEVVIDELPGVAESAVIGVPHPDFGEGGDGGGRAARPARDRRAAIIAQRCSDSSPTSRCRSGCSSCDELPRNAMGKVQKNLLREQHAKLYLKLTPGRGARPPRGFTRA